MNPDIHIARSTGRVHSKTVFQNKITRGGTNYEIANFLVFSYTIQFDEQIDKGRAFNARRDID